MVCKILKVKNTFVMTFLFAIFYLNFGEEVTTTDAPTSSPTKFFTEKFPSDVPIIQQYYNLIDATPMCYQKGLCPFSEWGNIHSIYPNAEERAIHSIRNIARLFPDRFRVSGYGAKLYGVQGDSNWKWGTESCGLPLQYNPVYWYTAANQMARFHMWDQVNCLKENVDHFTCMNPNRCVYFGSANSCRFMDRSAYFTPSIPGQIWTWSESIFNFNSGLGDANCESVFNHGIVSWGIGYYPGIDNNTQIGLRLAPPRTYPIYMVSHFDERSKIPPVYYNNKGKHFVFMLGWHGSVDEANPMNATGVYLIYDGKYHLMDRTFGTDDTEAIYSLHFNIPTECSPYAFIVKTCNGNQYRMPEQKQYYYGTANLPLGTNVPVQPGSKDYPICSENHYFKDANHDNKWLVNGAEGLNLNQIVSVKQEDCVGCSKIDVLENLTIPDLTATTQDQIKQLLYQLNQQLGNVNEQVHDLNQHFQPA